jgi:hypothetical protein
MLHAALRHGNITVTLYYLFYVCDFSDVGIVVDALTLVTLQNMTSALQPRRIQVRFCQIKILKMNIRCLFPWLPGPTGSPRTVSHAPTDHCRLPWSKFEHVTLKNRSASRIN